MLQYSLVVLLWVICAVAYPATVVPIDWLNVPNNTPPDRNLNSPYLGECVCDITRGLCDPYCCCDKDCAASAKASFSYCLPERYSSPYLDYCYPKDGATSLKRINNIDAIYIDKKIQGYSAVCVIRANHPSDLYRYFQVPTTVKQPSLPATASYALEANQSYKVGEFLATAKYSQVDGSLVYRRVAPFQLPIAASDGSCSTVGKMVGFLDAVQGTSCVLSGAQSCSVFPVANYANLFVQRRAGYNSTASELVPITMNIFNTSGALLGTIDPAVVPMASSYSTFSDGVTCHNAIVDFKTQFTYGANVSGTIVNSEINITINDVALQDYGAVSFSAAFLRENASFPTNIISATPGYLAGDKVRAGTLVSFNGKSAILERESGFAIPGGGRLCSENLWKRTNFLFSVKSSGCLVLMNESLLQSTCTTGTSDILRAVVNVTVNGTSTFLDRVAMTNDALANDTSSWISIEGLANALAPSSGIYNSYNRQCENVVVGLHYQFVIARAGAEYNPQDVIVGAFASPISGSLQIRNETNFSGAALSYQQFSFKVSFSRYDPNSQATIMRRVVAPPILPHLDDTIFYPFRRPYPL